MGIAHFFQFPFYCFGRYSRNLGQFLFRNGWFLKDGLRDRFLDVLFLGDDSFAILADQQQTAAEYVFRPADQVGKEVLKEGYIIVNVQSDIGIVGSDQGVPEIP